MRLTVALLTLACLAACDGVQTVSERSPARDDEWRQRQAELDAQAIMQGMAQARHRAEQLARRLRPRFPCNAVARAAPATRKSHR